MDNVFLDVTYVMKIKPYKGYSLLQIFQYSPKYIDWLIETTNEYYVDISKFEALPKSTPFTHTVDMIMPGGAVLKMTPKGVNNIIYALKYESEGNIIAEKAHVFSEKIKKINESKQNGDDYNYYYPYTVFEPNS